MPTPLYQLAHLEAKPGQEDALATLLHIIVQATRQHEPNCLQYDLWHDQDQPTAFVMVERWADQAALEFHRQQEHLRTFLREATPLMAHPILIKRYAYQP